jgi:hypothetical protein
MLNGFGEAQAIERERLQIANDFGARATFHPVDRRASFVQGAALIVLAFRVQA